MDPRIVLSYKIAPAVLVVGGIIGQQFLIDGRQPGLGLSDGDAGPESRDDGLIVVAAVFEVFRVARLDLTDLRQRHPQHRTHHWQRAVELGRRHADDGVRLSVHRDHSTDDLWIRREDAFPRAVADDRDRVRALTNVLIGSEQSPSCGIDAKHREVVGRHHLRGYGLCGAVGGDVDELK